MNWPQFRYIFTRDVENAMRYSIEEAIRRCSRQAGGGSAKEMSDEAIESFKRKMDKHLKSPAAKD